MVSGTHTIPIRIPKDMGMVWEAYHKGVPLLGVPENPIEIMSFSFLGNLSLGIFRHILR